MPSPELAKEAEIASLKKELDMANRDIADYYMGEGAGAGMMEQDVKMVEQHRDDLKARLKELGVDTKE
ncbi:MAG TPA: hypothetical protein VL500_07215 [Candidatus Eisenbacteria bacterium]|nr:hypothetical protein [Candidatus Eisenbacteria bacterium]